MSQATPDPDLDTLALSHLALRMALGVIGLCLPVVLILGTAITEVTPYRTLISAHYYAPNLGPVFVGSLCAIGVFLLYYRGYPNRSDAYVHPLMRTAPGRMASVWLTDRSVTNLAGIGALGTALFPTCLGPDLQPAGVRCTEGGHLGFAALFFLALTYMSLVQFTRSDRPRAAWDAEKRRDNAIHTTCGLVMAGCLGVIALDAATRLFPSGSAAVFWLEAVAVWAFGISWLVKGRALRDRRNPGPG